MSFVAIPASPGRRGPWQWGPRSVSMMKGDRPAATAGLRALSSFPGAGYYSEEKEYKGLAVSARPLGWPGRSECIISRNIRPLGCQPQSTLRMGHVYGKSVFPVLSLWLWPQSVRYSPAREPHSRPAFDKVSPGNSTRHRSYRGCPWRSCLWDPKVP